MSDSFPSDSPRRAREHDEPRNLILIRHSLPGIVEGVPARQWRLSEEGRQRAAELTGRVSAQQPVVIVSSVEPKARETGEVLAAQPGILVETAAGLHEHERDNVGYLGRDEFEAAVRDFFARPDELVLGRETAAQALARFGGAVDSVLSAYPTGNLAIVTHGTVMSLFVAHHTGIEPYPFWRALRLPDVVVLRLPGFDLVKEEF